mgnify:CR=1 FL=1
MNVFYNSDTRGLKELPVGLLDNTDCGQTAYFTRADAYIIDCEGELYRAPRYNDGSFNTDSFDMVDFKRHADYDGTVYVEMLTAVQDVLVCDAIHDPSGWYFKSAS